MSSWKTWIAVSTLCLSSGCLKDAGSPPEDAIDITPGGASGPGSTPPEQVAAGDRLDLGGLSVVVPEGWVVERPENAMRRGQFKLPSDEGGEPAQMVIFNFGQGQGGTVRDNLDRWSSQYSQPDGSDSREAATIEQQTVNGMAVTTIDLTGTLSSAVSMQDPSAGRNNKPDQRLIGAIVESPRGGMFFFKATGPKAVLDRWEASIEEFIASAR